MRLTEQEKTAIRSAVLEEDPTADIFLFGSRLDDNRKGGDIDLYIETVIRHDLVKYKARILATLWKQIGAQRIDIILKPRDIPLNSIHRLAKKTGIQL
jgi:predicted nucleotidyltransferase